MRKFLKYLGSATLLLYTSALLSQRIETQIHQKEDSTAWNALSRQLPSLGKRLIILDFWSTGCYSCIQAFADLEQLQEQFKDSLEIVLVSKESEDSLQQFFGKRPKLRLPTLRRIAGDSVLRQIFPHDAVPFHVWIDHEGKVLYQANGLNTNAKHISMALKGSKVDLEDYHKISNVSSFFMNDKLPHISYASYIAQCQQSVRIQPDQLQEDYHLTLECASIEQLYQYAYNESRFQEAWYNRSGRVSFEVDDSVLFRRPDNAEQYGDWVKEWSFTYHLILPSKKRGLAFSFMRKDLDRFFGFNSRIEKKIIPCLVLVPTSSLSIPRSEWGKKQFRIFNNYSADSSRRWIVCGQTVDRFVQVLGQEMEEAFQIPFVTSIDAGLIIDITVDLPIIKKGNLNEIREALRLSGFDIIHADWPIDVLIISK